MSVQTVGIIRNRGQLTIPDEIRRVASWVSTSSVITITCTKPDEIRIHPHQRQKKWIGIDCGKIFKSYAHTLVYTDNPKHQKNRSFLT